MRKIFKFFVGCVAILAITVALSCAARVQRYQVIPDEKGRVYKVDTATGETWWAGSSGEWHPMTTEEEE